MIRLHSSTVPVPDIHAMAATTTGALEQDGASDAAAPPQRPALCITEKWIRERLNLQLDSLDGVRSLALPGSYTAKITHLGRSLLCFTKLKHLDLSRNAIESLQGLEHLKHLETLNLYYNNIASLKELFHLRHNSKLKELDLRLNPVMRTEPDYRLFTIHMLLHLRKLDERSVMDSERRAALMHFDSDQAYQFDERVKSRQKHACWIPVESTRHVKARTQMVQSLAPPSALQDNTDELLELIRHNDHWETPAKSTVAGVTGARSPFYTEYTDTPPHSTRPKRRNVVNRESSRVRLEFPDEAEAYSDFKVKVNFTPAPQTSSEPVTEGGMGVEEGKGEEDEDILNGEMNTAVVTRLLHLLQEYIPTDISFLSRDTEFRGQLCKLWGRTGGSGGSAEVEQLQEEIELMRKQLEQQETTVKERDRELANMQEMVRQHESEAAALGRQLQTQMSEMEQHNSVQEEMQHLLQQANRDISSLQQHVRSLQEENAQLKVALDKAPTEAQVTKLKRRIGQLETENQSLQGELNQAHKHHRKETQNYSQLQELVTMLQESHRSLVATNDHLLRELEVVKLRHSQEITQMHHNYEHLKKTMHLVHSS